MAEPRRIVGVDSGINGAIALLLPDSLDPSIPDGIVDIPTVGEGNQREINYAALRDVLWRMRPDVVWLEIVNAMPLVNSEEDDKAGKPRARMGATSTFRFGGAYFVLKAAPAFLGIPLRLVSSVRWKKKFTLKGGPDAKEQARLRAIQLYPTLEPFMRRKKDHQRAEALLIAAYGAGADARPDREDEVEEKQHGRRRRSAGEAEQSRRDDPGLDIPD